MRLTDAWKVRDVLKRIKPEDNTYVKEAIAFLDREIAIRERQANRGKEDREVELIYTGI